MDADIPTPDAPATPRRSSWWFYLSIAVLVGLFVIVVADRKRIRAAWWAYRLSQAADLQDRGYYLALLSGDDVTATIGYQYLSDQPDADLRCLAVYLMQSCETAESTGEMGLLLDDADQAVRNAAAVGLAFRGDRYGAMAVLKRTLQDTHSPRASAAAAAGLGRFSATLSCPLLVKAVREHPSALVRAQAVESLGSLIQSIDESRMNSSISGTDAEGPNADSASEVRRTPEDCDIVLALVEAMDDRATFDGDLAVEREIQSAAAFATASGRPADANGRARSGKDRSVGDIAAGVLSDLLGREILSNAAGAAAERQTLIDECRAEYARRMASRRLNPIDGAPSRGD